MACISIWYLNFECMQVKGMREEYAKLDKAEMSIWECCELLNEVVDESDPDLDEPQIQHLLQSAEAIRKDYPDEDWLQLTALIHGIYPCYDSLILMILRIFWLFSVHAILKYELSSKNRLSNL